MGTIVVSQNITLDGVVEDPTGEAGFSHGGWFNDVGDADHSEWAKFGYEEALGASAMLMGRLTDEYLGPRWNGRSGEWAERLNSLPKFVVSSTIETPIWTNSTVLHGDVVDEVSKLKERVDGEIVVNASRQLVQTLWMHNLVDQLRLVVYPFVLGSGGRLFPQTMDMSMLRLTGSRPIGDSLVLLTYDVAN